MFALGNNRDFFPLSLRCFSFGVAEAALEGMTMVDCSCSGYQPGAVLIQ